MWACMSSLNEAETELVAQRARMGLLKMSSLKQKRHDMIRREKGGRVEGGEGRRGRRGEGEGKRTARRAASSITRRPPGPHREPERGEREIVRRAGSGEVISKRQMHGAPETASPTAP